MMICAIRFVSVNESVALEFIDPCNTLLAIDINIPSLIACHALHSPAPSTLSTAIVKVSIP